MLATTTEIKPSSRVRIAIIVSLAALLLTVLAPRTPISLSAIMHRSTARTTWCDERDTPTCNISPIFY